MPSPTRLRHIPEFRELFRQFLNSSGMSQRSFSRLVAYKHPNLNGILRGKRKPPLAHIQSWAAALDLSPSQTNDLIVAAWLANAPPELRDYVNALIKVAYKEQQTQ